MTTVGSKFWFAVTGLGVVAIVAWVLFSDSEPVGLLVLTSLVVASTILGTLSIVVRDGDVPAAAVETEVAAATAPRTQLPAPWPALGALGAGVTAIGAASGNALFYVGIGILVVTLAEWMVQGWAERATGDPAFNLGLRNRLMFPVEVPVVALLGAGAVLLAFSRVLLALPKTGSTVVAIVVAAGILGVAALVATRPRVSSGLVSAVVVIGAVGLLGGGIVGAVAGEREFEAGEEEGGGEGGGEGDFTLTITQDGFEPARLEIPAGQQVTITVVNEYEEGRDFGITVQGVEGQPSTGTIEFGQSENLELTAEPGTYTIVSTVNTQAVDPGELVATEEEGGTAPEGSEAGEPGGANDEEPDTREDTENPDGGEQDPDSTTDVSAPDSP